MVSTPLDTSPPASLVQTTTSAQALRWAARALTATCWISAGLFGLYILAFYAAALLDGQSSIGGHGLADGQAIDLLLELTPGSHTFALTARDAVDNVATATVPFEVVVTASSIRASVDVLFSLGDIENHGIRSALLDKLARANAYRDAGNCTAAAEVYRAFIQQVDAQTGKSISARAARILTAQARHLIEHCP